jgi:hypothetical protein
MLFLTFVSLSTFSFSNSFAIRFPDVFILLKITPQDNGCSVLSILQAVFVNKYVAEVLGLPDGFGDRTVSIKTSDSGVELLVPARCMNAPMTMDTPSFAAYGLELLIAKDPLLFPAML